MKTDVTTTFSCWSSNKGLAIRAKICYSFEVMRNRMKKIISLLLLVGAVSANAASLELKVKQQKTLPNGNAYGLESGIYFELTDLEPFIMYKLQYSEDLKSWTDLVHLGTYKMAMTSPYWTWKELPPVKCFFRIVVAW
jgi:hypothetical protein